MISRRIAALFVVVMLMIVAAVPAAHAQTTVGTITQLHRRRDYPARLARPSRQRRTCRSCCTIKIATEPERIADYRPGR